MDNLFIAIAGNISAGKSTLTKILAKKLKAKKISKAVFDRSGYKYHGRIAALADSMRKEGIEF